MYYYLGFVDAGAGAFGCDVQLMFEKNKVVNIAWIVIITILRHISSIQKITIIITAVLTNSQTYGFIL